YRDRMTLRRLECPKLFGRLEVDPLPHPSLSSRERGEGEGVSGRTIARINGPLLDPGRKVCDYRVGQLSPWRHLKVLIVESLQKQAGRRIVRNDGGAALAAFADAIAAVQEQSTSDLLRAGRMAFIAMLDQDGPNLLLEEL